MLTRFESRCSDEQSSAFPVFRCRSNHAAKQTPLRLLANQRLRGRNSACAIGGVLFFVVCLIVFPGFSSPVQAQADSSSPFIAEAMQPFIDRGEIPGIVSILATKDKIVQIDSLGWADREKQIPIRPDQVFWIASASKIFTAAAVMMLVDEGKIHLDDPVEKYLPCFQKIKVGVPQEDGSILLRAPKRKTTVRHLLSHVAGWYFVTEFTDTFGIDSMPPVMAAFHFSQTPLHSDPGDVYHYSENGIVTAGAIIEVVSGMPYHEFMQKRIFDPLGMRETTFWPSSEVQENCWIKSYTLDHGKRTTLTQTKIGLLSYPLEDRCHRYPEPGAGIFSTAFDMTKFFQMLAARGVYSAESPEEFGPGNGMDPADPATAQTRLLSEAAVDEISRKQTADSIEMTYGLGAFIDGEWFGHGGAHGNDSQVTRDGLVRLYVIQAVDCPKLEEAKNAWKEAALETFRAKGLHD